MYLKDRSISKLYIIWIFWKVFKYTILSNFSYFILMNQSRCLFMYNLDTWERRDNGIFENCLPEESLFWYCWAAMHALLQVWSPNSLTFRSLSLQCNFLKFQFSCAIKCHSTWGSERRAVWTFVSFSMYDVLFQSIYTLFLRTMKS